MPIRLTRTVKILLIANFVMFVLQQAGDLLGNNLFGIFALSSVGFFHQHQLWQLLTYSFVHHDVLQLFFNLLMLAFIGSELEVVWGQARFLRYYFFCALTSAFVFLALSLISPRPGIMFGASSPIYGLLVAYGLIFGERVLLFMMLFPLKAKHFIWVLAGLELMTATRGNLYAVLGGLAAMPAGFAYLWLRATFLASRVARQQSKSYQKKLSKYAQLLKKRKNNHLKLVIDNEKEEEGRKQAGRSRDPEDDDENNPKTWH